MAGTNTSKYKFYSQNQIWHLTCRLSASRVKSKIGERSLVPLSVGTHQQSCHRVLSDYQDTMSRLPLRVLKDESVY